MEGTIKWRHHDTNLDVCIMTDYSPTNGNIIPGSFVHVTRQHTEDGKNIISCTCEIYKNLQGIAYRQRLGEETENLYPDTTMTCMHCRYFENELENAYNTLQNYKSPLVSSRSEELTAIYERSNPTLWQCSGKGNNKIFSQRRRRYNSVHPYNIPAKQVL